MATLYLGGGVGDILDANNWQQVTFISTGSSLLYSTSDYCTWRILYDSTNNIYYSIGFRNIDSDVELKTDIQIVKLNISNPENCEILSTYSMEHTDSEGVERTITATGNGSVGITPDGSKIVIVMPPFFLANKFIYIIYNINTNTFETIESFLDADETSKCLNVLCTDTGIEAYFYHYNYDEYERYLEMEGFYFGDEEITTGSEVDVATGYSPIYRYGGYARSKNSTKAAVYCSVDESTYDLIGGEITLGDNDAFVYTANVSTECFVQHYCCTDFSNDEFGTDELFDDCDNVNTNGSKLYDRVDEINSLIGEAVDYYVFRFNNEDYALLLGSAIAKIGKLIDGVVNYTDMTDLPFIGCAIPYNGLCHLPGINDKLLAFAPESILMANKFWVLQSECLPLIDEEGMNAFMKIKN